jgi:hypothetical protein
VNWGRMGLGMATDPIPFRRQPLPAPIPTLYFCH